MTDIHSFSPACAPHRLKELLEDLRLNHEYCPREVILQAADVIEHLVKEQALAQPVQEPVAWMNPSWIDPDTRGWQSASFESTSIEGWIPIYNTPPQRQWVGLTDEEVENLCLSLGAEPIEVRFIEAKLKEKNT